MSCSGGRPRARRHDQRDGAIRRSGSRVGQRAEQGWRSQRCRSRCWPPMPDREGELSRHSGESRLPGRGSGPRSADRGTRVSMGPWTPEGVSRFGEKWWGRRGHYRMRYPIPREETGPRSVGLSRNTPQSWLVGLEGSFHRKERSFRRDADPPPGPISISATPPQAVIVRLPAGRGEGPHRLHNGHKEIVLDPAGSVSRREIPNATNGMRGRKRQTVFGQPPETTTNWQSLVSWTRWRPEECTRCFPSRL